MRRSVQSTLGTYARVGLGCLGLLLIPAAANAQSWEREPLPPPDPGYSLYYHDGEATASRATRWGFHDGLFDGQRDAVTGHSFRPTQDSRYHEAPDHGNHAGISRQQYKDLYRDAYMHGYEQGYKREYRR